MVLVILSLPLYWVLSKVKDIPGRPLHNHELAETRGCVPVPRYWMSMTTLSTPTDEAKLQGRSLDSNRRFPIAELDDRFVEVLFWCSLPAKTSEKEDCVRLHSLRRSLTVLSDV